MTALHLHITKFKFTHHLIICDQLLDAELIFGTDIQRKFSLSYAWDKDKNCYIQKEGKFSTYTRNCEQKTPIDMVKSTLKIPPRYIGVIAIKMKGPVIQENMAYFLVGNNTIKGKDPNINIINGIHTIKDKTSVTCLVSNYTNKHVTFHKGEYIVHFEPVIVDDSISEETNSCSTNRITLRKMMDEQVTLDTFTPPCHKLDSTIQAQLDTLLKDYECQFAKDEISIGTTP